ncbi:Multimodular transpeptidase-transglycosylase [hydrothermal vent metagenome]|uniref:peptidoglycan glycosyltransferase n=1 Tax=hydrothermal vent metagenome TaxID=652676 RepID=A0A3B1E747_9ZZZZ
MIKKLFIVFILLSVGLLIWLLTLYSQIRFDLQKIIDYKPQLTSIFLDKYGNHVANIFDKEHRLPIKFKNIPPRVIESLVAIEDTQFFEHNGINIEAISRALIKDIKARKLIEGASTITQQLVKTIVLTRDKKIIRKIKEILLSLKLESLLTKEEIIERYLNHIYFGHGYYGVKTASLGYFHKHLNELTLKEIALLVGLPRAPSFYDPTKNFNFSLTRANQVLSRLHTLGWINDTEYKESLNYTPVVYDDTLTQNKAPYAIDIAIKELQKNIPDIKSGGYTISLTIDLEAQNIAREALQYGYEKIKNRDLNGTTSKTLNGAILVLENNTGEILAMIGGMDYKISSFNRAYQSKRQPGSATKPFIYQVALDLGYSTASNLIDISRTYMYEDANKTVQKWKPKNYEKDFKGLIPLRQALVHSRNLATINLVTEIGIDVLYKKLKYYGFKDIPFDLSVTLGSFGISLVDLSKQYTIFSNNGIQNKPFIIKSVTNINNNTITFEPSPKYIISPSQSYLMTSILSDVVKKGTGRKAKVKGLELAGKTGTTNNNIDTWFCGYSPSLQTIVWYGNDDNTPMNTRETGGRSAAPAFSFFYKEWLKIHPEIQRKFIKPDGVFTSIFNGKKEYFTNISNIPTIKVNNSRSTEDEIHF